MDDAEAGHTRIVERVAAAEGLRPEMIEPLTEPRTGAPVGEVATLAGVNVDKAVGYELDFGTADPAWRRAFHVFARVASLVPHLSLEWSGSVTDDRVLVFVDLLPRVDLAVNLDYVDEVYGPLTGADEALADIPGVLREPVPPRRAVATSPWRLSVSAPGDRIDALGVVLDRYVDRWLEVNSGGVGSPVDPLASDPARLVQHDRFHRNAFFDAGSDPCWERVDHLVGPDAAAALRLTLRSQRER